MSEKGKVVPDALYVQFHLSLESNMKHHVLVPLDIYFDKHFFISHFNSCLTAQPAGYDSFDKNNIFFRKENVRFTIIIIILNYCFISSRKNMDKCFKSFIVRFINYETV